MSSSTTAKRKQAPRLARPAARYWKGKAPKGVTEQPDSDEDSENEAQVGVQDEDADEAISGEQDFTHPDEGEGEDEEGDDMEAAVANRTLAKETKAMNISLKDVNIRDGKVIVAGREESGRTVVEQEEESEEEEEEEDEEEEGIKKEGDESSEYESSSEEEEEPPKPQFRPVFVPKRGRVTIAEREAVAEDNEEVLRKKEAEAEERKRESHDLVAQTIRRELAAKEKEEEMPDVDDTDGLDDQAEFEAWKLRELGRIKRDKEDELRREREREEIEKRRALPEEQRLREDLEHAEKTRAEKPKGQQKFLQKYWHKGAFHQDEEILKKHDYTEATESTLDITLLPKVMQVRNFGKRSQTKYTHLVDQDTSVQGAPFGQTRTKDGKDAPGCFICGGPHLKKDCPQNPGPGFHGRMGGPSSDGKDWKKGDTVAQWRGDERDGRPPPPRYEDGGWKDKARRKSRSRSPRRHRDDDRGGYRDNNRGGRYKDDDRGRFKDDDRDRYRDNRDRERDKYRGSRRSRSRSRERTRTDDGYREKRRRFD